jgi:IS5 family transposase
MFKQNKGAVEIADQWLASAPPNQTLEALERLIDWKPISRRLASAYAPAHRGGRRGFDPVMMLKLVLLQHWYGLSDARVVEEAADRFSFRRFLGMGVGDVMPDATSLVRFRDRLLENGDLLDEVLDYVNTTIQSHGFALNTGRIVDATLVAARTRPRKDGGEAEIEPEADKTVKNGQPHHGYKMHMATDVETNVVLDVQVTPASRPDAEVFEQFVPDNTPVVYADRGYEGQERRRRLRERGVRDHIMRRAARGHALTQEAKEQNRRWSRVRQKIERKFGEMKLWHGLDRMRYLGLAKGRLQALAVAIVTNLKFLVAKCA